MPDGMFSSSVRERPETLKARGNMDPNWDWLQDLLGKCLPELLILIAGSSRLRTKTCGLCGRLQGVEDSGAFILSSQQPWLDSSQDLRWGQRKRHVAYRWKMQCQCFWSSHWVTELGGHWPWTRFLTSPILYKMGGNAYVSSETVMSTQWTIFLKWPRSHTRSKPCVWQIVSAGGLKCNSMEIGRTKAGQDWSEAGRVAEAQEQATPALPSFSPMVQAWRHLLQTPFLLQTGALVFPNSGLPVHVYLWFLVSFSKAVWTLTLSLRISQHRAGV